MTWPATGEIGCGCLSVSDTAWAFTYGARLMAAERAQEARQALEECGQVSRHGAAWIAVYALAAEGPSDAN